MKEPLKLNENDSNLVWAAKISSDMLGKWDAKKTRGRSD
jgi:hypothetical protein